MWYCAFLTHLTYAIIRKQKDILPCRRWFDQHHVIIYQVAFIISTSNVSDTHVYHRFLKEGVQAEGFQNGFPKFFFFSKSRWEVFYEDCFKISFHRKFISLKRGGWGVGGLPPPFLNLFFNNQCSYFAKYDAPSIYCPCYYAIPSYYH